MATLSPTTPVTRPSSQESQSSSSSNNNLTMKPYDFLLKFLLVGDSDVGKEEILNGLANGTNEFPYGYSTTGILYKTTTIPLDGKIVKLQLWDASGQGRFCTIFRSYSRGAHGILLVYDITNRWSFDGIDRWIKEIDELAPGVPKILVGNRCHLAFKREVSELAAEEYALRNDMTFYEVSPLCDFNVTESLIELSRVALRRNGIRGSWGLKTVLSLQECCTRVIVDRTSLFNIDKLPLPTPLRTQVKAYQVINKPHPRTSSSTLHSNKPRKHKIIRPSDSPSSLSYHHSCSIT